MSASVQHRSDSDRTASSGPPRRGFLAAAVAAALGAVALAVPAVVGLVAALNPLRQKSQGGDFIKLTVLGVLPEDGTPRTFPVIADRVDAWNRFPNEPIGAVFLRRTKDRKRPVEALQVICPHAGCTIQYESSPEGGEFICPCHGAGFDLDGKRLEANSQSPRDMDTLEVELRGEQVLVKFQDFRTGTSQKVVKA